MRLQGAIDLTQIKHTWRGNWEPSEVYYLNDVVKYGGLSFVCVTTNLSDEQRYGLEYRPTVANEYWNVFSQGYLNKGQWEYKQYYYPGDVVQYNEDWYLCNTYNFGGHPIYEDGGLSSKWTLIAKSPLENRSRNHLWLAGYGPMGWTKNHCENNDQFWTQEIQGFSTIDGNYCKTYIGRFTSSNYHGTGEANPTSLYHPSRPGYDFWDYYDGYRPSITGGTPKCIQVTTSWYNQFMLFDNGEVYATGYGGNGQNGDGTNTSYQYVRRVGRSGERGTGVLRDVFIVKLAPSFGNSHVWAANYQHILALDSNGGVWSWGYGGYGCLGHGDSIAANNIPRLINKKYFDNSRIVDIWAVGTGSYQTSYALDENGQLWAWGYGGYGQLGIDEYYTNTAGVTDANPRPQKVSIDFTDYGGIKKIMFSGSSNVRTIVALTNDNQLWSWGYSNYSAAWGAGATATVIGRPRQLQRLIYEQAQSLGKNGTRNVGSSIDVANNAEDFWLDAGSGYETLFIKEKNTNLMFGLGYQSNSSMSLTDQAVEIAQNTNLTLSASTDVSYPSLLSIGNASDIKYMIKHNSGTSAREYYFLNRDGRVFNSGNTTGITAKGIGANYTTEPHSKSAKLPWEGDLNAGTSGVTQVRWKDKFNMITGHYEGGFGGITKQNRFVFVGPADATYPLFPYAGEITGNAQAMHNPTRLGYF